MASYFCSDETVAANGVDHVYALDAAEAMFDRGGVFVDLDVGAGVENVGLRLELSDDGATWYQVYVWVPFANAYAAAVALAVDTQVLAFSLHTYAPYLRFIANNTGANAATLTAFFIPQV